MAFFSPKTFLGVVDALIGRVKITDGTDVADVLDLTSNNGLAVAILDGSGDQITSFGGGTQYTEDAAAAANPVGTVPILVRADTPAGITTTDGDNVAQRGTDYGAAYVTLLDTGGSPVSVGGGTQYTEDAAAAANPVGNALIMVRDDALSGQTTTDGDNVAARGTDKGELYVKHADTLTVDGSGVTQPISHAALTELAAAIDTEVQVDVVGSLPAGDNNIGNVDIASALPAGTNAIGKLAANSGVDIGDVDVTSMVSATLDHGANRDVDTAAEQITSTSFTCKFGVRLRADPANTGILYIGNSDVTAATDGATDGFPLRAGESMFIPCNNSNIPYAIASANNQIIYWFAV